MANTGILVTGGAGFIGSNLVDLLVEKGHAVYILDDLSTGKLDNISEQLGEEHVKFIRGDVRTDLKNSLTARNLGDGPTIDAIFHLAARVDVTSSFQEPSADAAINYLGTLNVLDHALREGIRKVIFASSAAVYGDTSQVPVAESGPTIPLSPYGLHKLSSERMLRIYGAHYGMRCTSLRFFNVYGPRQDPSSPYSGVISRFMEKGTRREPMLIFGDGRQTRDFVYVGDVAAAMYMAYLRGDGAVLNVGTGKETSVNELARTVMGITGSNADPVHMPARKGEILRSCASTDDAKEVIGFSAETSLGEGLTLTCRYFKGRR